MQGGYLVTLFLFFNSLYRNLYTKRNCSLAKNSHTRNTTTCCFYTLFYLMDFIIETMLKIAYTNTKQSQAGSRLFINVFKTHKDRLRGSLLTLNS